MDGVIKNADLIKGVVGDNLRNSLSELDRNVELVSLKDDVDLNAKFEDLLTLNPNQEELDKIFKELEFAPMNKDKDEQTPKKNGKYETILNKKDLNSWINKIKKSKAFAIDTETDSVQTVSANMLGISVSVEENEGCYIPIGHNYEGCPEQLSMDEVITVLGPIIEENQDKIVGQNLKFDIPILSRHGINITKFLADTMLSLIHI